MRPLRRIPVPPGAAGVLALADHLSSALDGSGAAIAPIPVTSPTVSDTYVRSLLRALRPDDADSPLESDDIAVVLATSGSTGDPQGVLHTADSLTALSAQVNGVNRDPQSNGADRGPQWIVALPVTSMGGFNVLIRALDSGREPIAMESIGGARPFLPVDFAAAVAASTTTDIRVSLVAAQVRRLLADEAGTEALRACTQVLVGAGPTPATIVAAAGALGINLTLTYGATETAGGCVYNGSPLEGVTIHIDGGDPGHIIIDGPMLARGYRCDPDRTALQFTPTGFRTKDLGSMHNGVLTLHGRVDDVVIVDGVNVSLGAVQRALEEHPDVAAAATLDLGDDEPAIAAVLVLRDASDVSVVNAIDANVERSLGRHAVPRRVALVPALPTLPNGKVDRRGLIDDALHGRLTWHR